MRKEMERCFHLDIDIPQDKEYKPWLQQGHRIQFHKSQEEKKRLRKHYPLDKSYNLLLLLHCNILLHRLEDLWLSKHS